MKAHQILDRAKSTLDQRGIDNGYDAGQERSAAKVAVVFNALTGKDLTEHDAWLFMICLKLVRNESNPGGDSALDLVGYAALMAECDGADAGVLEAFEPWLNNDKPRSAAELNFDAELDRACRMGGRVWQAIRSVS